jgi:rod shape-determining protein MreC
MGEILYDARDPSTRRIVLDRGTRNGVQPGLPVIDNAGVIGQVTRVFPFTSEVTLLTDREQAIPVQVLRSGLRSIAYGRGRSGQLDLRFVAPDADIQVGDVIVTSGLDGMYPAGLAVAKVVQVEKVAAGAFGRVVCQPLGGVDRNRQLLIVMSGAVRAPRPTDPPAPPAHGAARRNLPKMDPVPAPPLAASPLPAQGAPTQPGTNSPAGTGAAPAANPAPTAPATAPANAPAPARTTVPAGTGVQPAPSGTARPAAPPSAPTTAPVQAAQPTTRKEGA